MTTIFTTCTYNHLARAFSLADSVEKYCPEANFVIGLIDQVSLPLLEKKNFEVMYAEELRLPFLSEMNAKYTTLELNSALKPYFARHLFHVSEVEKVLYLDSDILLFNNFDSFDILLNEYSVLLSPHALSSIDPEFNFDDRNFLLSGIYNAGFFGVKRDINGLGFLDWWKDKLKDQCFIDAKKGMFAEQLWLNLVPLYFEKVHIVRNLGANVAYWNLHERYLSCVDQVWMVNEIEPLLFFHFSGASINCIEEDNLSVHQNRYTFSNRPDVKPLFEIYIEALKKHGFNNFDGYKTISANFKTRFRPLIFLAEIYRKALKVIFYR